MNTNQDIKQLTNLLKDLIEKISVPSRLDELTNEMNDFVKKNDYYDYVLDNKFKLLAGLDCNIVIIM